MGVVVGFELVQCVDQVGLVPDQGLVEQFAPAGADPSLHDRIHAWYPYAGQDGVDPCLGEDLVEEGGEFAIPVPDHVSDRGFGVLEVHGEVACGLGYPFGSGVGCCVENADAAGGVLDDGQGVEALSGQGDGFEEVAGQDGGSLVVQE